MIQPAWRHRGRRAGNPLGSGTPGRLNAACTGIQPWLNGLAAARPALAEAAGYYYGLLRFLATAGCWPGCNGAGPRRSADCAPRWYWPQLPQLTGQHLP